MLITTFLFVAWFSDGSHHLVLARKEEPGKRLEVSGVVYDSEGRPAPGVTIHIHQTGDDGEYHEDESGAARLSGVLVTDAHGRYRISTIKPGAYPGYGPPAHLHFRLTGPDGVSYNRDLWFEGDPRITAKQMARHGGDGRFSMIRPLEEDQGVLRFVRDFRPNG